MIPIEAIRKNAAFMHIKPHRPRGVFRIVPPRAVLSLATTHKPDARVKAVT